MKMNQSVFSVRIKWTEKSFVHFISAKIFNHLINTLVMYKN